MKCEEILDILSDYVDGELARGQCQRIQEHLEVCPHCREFVETFRESLEIAHGLDKKLPPQDVCESVLQAFRESCRKKNN
ncbi:MAG: hypothetical protein GXO70_02500 [Acidobacteria bacterium]|nr:hypothetical protein [Acidobacteriota bacterium]